MIRRVLPACCMVVFLLTPGPALPGAEVTLTLETPMAPPAWALPERELLRAHTFACREFFRRYFDERGYLLCVERRGGDDGPDDAIENVNDWPILHAPAAGRCRSRTPSSRCGSCREPAAA